MRIGGMDISKNKIGLAFSDIDCLFISYENTIIVKGNRQWKSEFIEIFLDYKPDLTYVGIPDSSSSNHNFCKQFAHNYRNIIGRFEFTDENFSTAFAENLINEKLIKSFNSVDSIVARDIVFTKMQQLKICEKN